MICVMGATGQTGRVVVEKLLRAGAAVRVVTRSRERAAALWNGDVEIAEADPQDAAALADAFRNVEAAYVMVPPYVTSDDCIGESKRAADAIAAAAVSSGVPRLVALSSGGTHLESGSGIIATLRNFEAVLRATPIPVTYVRPGDFMENWASVLHVASAAGILPSGRLPLDGKMETVSVRDIGAVAAQCLLQEQQGPRFVNVLGPQDYTPIEVAGALSELLGRDVTAVPADRTAISTALIEAGCSDSYVEAVLELYDGLNSGLVTFEPGVGETVRGQTTIGEALQDLLATMALPTAA